jgi:rubrerythrin
MRLIDADALLGDIAKTIEESGCVSHENEIIDCIEYAPLVEYVEYATWIGISDGDADGNPVYDRWECSQCGYYAGEERPDWKFCPNCGNPMVKGELW